ncbi:MAG: NAD-dependent epimerase/dehydratase family protein [Bacillota bacterium]
MRTQIKFRTGLIGAGYISEYHIAALRRLPQVQLLGVTDTDPAKAERLRQRFNVETFSSLTALREAGADVIHVLTPPHTHAPIALAALDLGCHVLVEKPLATSVDDCRKIQTLADEKGLAVCVNHSLLFDPQVRRALQFVRQGKLGRIISVDILRSSVYPPYMGGPLPPQYRTAGYPFRDLAVHTLYLFEAFLGPIEHVHGDWKSFGGDPNLPFDEWRAQVRCRDGLGQFQLSWNIKPLQSQMIIQGTKGILRVDLFLMFHARRAALPIPKPAERVINAFTDSLRPLFEVPLGVCKFICGKVRPYHGLQDLVAAFYDALGSRLPVPVSVSDAIRVVRWTEQIARAADREHQRRLEPLVLSEQVPVLVTGASGGLGSEVVRRLRAEGKRVRLFVRRPPERVLEGTEIAIGNLGDPDAVDRAVRGASSVVHIGAAMKGGLAEHESATIVGTRNVLDACVKYHVEKLVHISSMSVVDWATGPRNSIVSEASPLEPRPEDRGHYTRAKLAAEKLVLQYHREHNLPVVILRPGQIFGGRIPLLTPAVARRLGNRWLVLGNGDIRLPLIHIDDVVNAITLALNSDLRDAPIIQLIANNCPTQNEVLQLALDSDARILRIPSLLVFLAGLSSEILLKLLGRKSPLSRYRLRAALSRHRFQSLNCNLLPTWHPTGDIRDRILEAMQTINQSIPEPAQSPAESLHPLPDSFEPAPTHN